ncbi:MAG: hypothetical protein IKI65_04200, partial [Firmicutes bacterium]|nr:hypothetical protein [Bacillota bacterium]
MRKILVFALIVAMAFTTAFAASSSTASVAGKTANIVTVDPGTVKAMLTLGQDSVAKDMNFSDHIAKAKSAFGNTPLMSINGTYFNSYYKTNQELAFPGNCALIQQTLMMDGEVVIGGGDGRKMTLGITGDGRFIVGNVAIKPYVVINGESYYFWGINQLYSDTYAVELFTDKLGYSVPVPAGSTVLWIKGGRIERIENSLSITVPAGYKAVVFHQG